jgi:hypothetical protein
MRKAIKQRRKIAAARGTWLDGRLKHNR